MPDLSYLVPILLLCRVALDVFVGLSGTQSYRFDLAYFLVFLAAGITIVSVGTLDLWGALSFGLSAFSLFQFIAKRATHVRNKSSSTT